MPIRLGVEVMNSKQQLSGIEKLVSLKIEIKIIIDFRNVPYWSKKVSSKVRIWQGSGTGTSRSHTYRHRTRTNGSGAPCALTRPNPHS